MDYDGLGNIALRSRKTALQKTLYLCSKRRVHDTSVSRREDLATRKQQKAIEL
jgi:hypothetical protein